MLLCQILSETLSSVSENIWSHPQCLLLWGVIKRFIKCILGANLHCNYWQKQSTVRRYPLEKVFLKISHYSLKNTLCWSLFLIKLQAWRPEGLQACDFIKKKLQRSCFIFNNFLFPFTLKVQQTTKHKNFSYIRKNKTQKVTPNQNWTLAQSPFTVPRQHIKLKRTYFRALF